MIEVDSAQREARAREVRHDAVATLTAAAHRLFRYVFAVQWVVASVIVVDKLKGSLHFETETGKGTTYYIRLPVSDVAAVAHSNHKQAAA